MEHSSKITISKSAYQKNLELIKGFHGEESSLSSVVKGNAYGHGINVFVPMAEECGVNHFSVFNAHEAKRVYESRKKDSEIMIMGHVPADQLSWVIDREIQFFVSDLHRLKKLIPLVYDLNVTARIHLEVETGMNRTGLSRKDLPEAIGLIKANSHNIEIEGICTHFAGAESIANHVRVQNQIKSFRKLKNYLDQNEIRAAKAHAACSAAMIRYPKTCFDMVRVGILQYGFWPSQEIMIHYLQSKRNQEDPLERLITWKSEVMSIKEVKVNQFVGYGTSYLTDAPKVLATIPVGYAYGYSRSLSNQSRVIVNGHYAPVAGIINMNLLTVDISHIPGVEVGDEAILVGNQEDKEIPVSSFSDISNQLNYELLTRIPADIPRTIIP